MNLVKTLLTTAIVVSLVSPVLADEKLTQFLGYKTNISSELKGEEIVMGAIHNPSRFGLEVNYGKLNYSEAESTKNPEPFVAKIDNRLDAKALKIGFSAFYNPEINSWANFIIGAGNFKIEGEGKLTTTAYGAPPFENVVQSKEERAEFFGEMNEFFMGFNFGDEKFKLGLLASGVHIQAKYMGVEADPIDLFGLTGKIVGTYFF